MKRLLLITGLLILAADAFSQEDPKALKYGGMISADDAKKHLSILASDEFEGRETGTPGAEKAANYLADEFKKLGLQAPVGGSYFLPVPLLENKLAINFSINGSSPNREADYYIPDVSANLNVNAEEVLFVGYGTETELGTADIRGKVIMWINEDMPLVDGRAYRGLAPSPDRAARFRAMLRRSPAMVLAVNQELAAILKKYGEATVDDPMTIKTKTPQQISKDPLVVHITYALADKLLLPSKRTFSQLAGSVIGKADVVKPVLASIKMNYQVTPRDLTANNVLGYLPGTDLKDELVIFSAHYDHVGLTWKEGDKVNNGADDDGSGTTGILEIAKAFSNAKNAGDGPRRSVLFLANVGEEKGLLGSKYYTDHPVFPLKNTVADINIDMIGRVGYDYAGIPDSANYIYVVGPNIMSQELKQISQEVNLKYDQLILDHKYDDVTEKEQLFFRSDHYNFAEKGIPVIFYTDGEHADYHKASDEVSRINFPLLVKRARLAFYTGWELANREKRPKAESLKKSR